MRLSMPKSFIHTLAIVFIFFMGYCISFRSTYGVVEYIASYMAYPVLRMQQKIIDPLKIWLTNWQTNKELKAVADHVLAEQKKLLAENIKLHAMLAYAQETEEVRAFKMRYKDDKACIAQVLVRHFSNQEHYFLVNVGASRFVRKDMVAIYNNCLVGRVTHVYPWYSKVKLITDQACHVATYCLKTKVLGIHKGLNQIQETELTFVTHLDHVEIDDLVFSSGQGLVFPQGFALGRITLCKTNGLHQNILIKPLIDLYNVKYCVLIAKGN